MIWYGYGDQFYSSLLILQDLLRDTDDHDLGPAISHFFNCFFGQSQAVHLKGMGNNVQSRIQKKVQYISCHSFISGDNAGICLCYRNGMLGKGKCLLNRETLDLSA